MRWGAWARVCALLWVASLLAASAAIAQAADPATEYAVKAAYVFNFAKFIEWPQADDRDGKADFNVCVIGNDPFGSALDALEGKSVRNRVLHVLRVPSSNTQSSCNIAFVGSREPDKQLLDELAKKGVVTIGDSAGFIVAGGIIAFDIVDNRLQFDINLVPIVPAGVKFSAQLLKLAHKVAGTN